MKKRGGKDGDALDYGYLILGQDVESGWGEDNWYLASVTWGFELKGRPVVSRSSGEA